MVCAAEHWFVLDYAMTHCSWLPEDRFGYTGWRSGGADFFNQMTVLPDYVGDWLWQKFPFAPSVLRHGLGRIRRDFDSGDAEAAALKLALLSHYLADVTATSHSWLDIFGDETDFEFDDEHAAVKHFHDPVENRVGDLLPRLEMTAPAATPSSFAECFDAAVDDAYRIGRRVFDAYFASLKIVAPMPSDTAVTPPLECIDALQLEGVRNAAAAVWALWEFGVRDGGDGLPCDNRQAEHWTLCPVLDWSAAEIRSRAFLPETIQGFRDAQGWSGGDIFRAPERCSAQAREQLALWQTQRAEWRAGMMADLLPPRPGALITANWRPDTGTDDQ